MFILAWHKGGSGDVVTTQSPRLERAMVPKQILASFPCRIRRRARFVSGASIGGRAKERARSRFHTPALSFEPRCSSLSRDSFAT